MCTQCWCCVSVRTGHLCSGGAVFLCVPRRLCSGCTVFVLSAVVPVLDVLTVPSLISVFALTRHHSTRYPLVSSPFPPVTLITCITELSLYGCTLT